MAWNTGLTGVHLDIASFNGPHLRVIAGPGTGKTFALMRRITRLLEEGVDPKCILAVTFTRTAASDLVEKLATLGAPGAKQVTAKTLHALSFGLLNRAGVFQQLGRFPRPLMDHEKDCLVCDLQEEFGGKREVNRLMLAFEGYWATLQIQQPGWPASEDEKAFDRALRSWLVFHQAMLIGEVVPLALDYVQQNPASPDVVSYRHVVVDEYQDLNRADQELVSMLAQGALATIVGDEDQSIYSFRYAHPEGITVYSNTHQPTHDEYLTECRRCPHIVVSMANSLIGRNLRQMPKVLEVFGENGPGAVYIVQHDTLEDEVQTLTEFVDHYLTTNPQVNAGEVLILANRRSIGNLVRDALNCLVGRNERAWSAQSFYFEDALKPEKASESFALLTLLVNPEDRPALRYWLGECRSDSRRVPYARLRSHCESTNMPIFNALQALRDGTLNLPHSTPLLSRYAMLRQRLAELATLKLSDLVDMLFPLNDSNVAALRQVALSVLDSTETAAELLVKLSDDITQPELPGPQDGLVRIMSLHKSKGLTARLVIMAGCVNGVIPSIDFDSPIAEQAKQREEQRRLFFVGITRATESLVLSSAIRIPTARALKMGITVGRRSGNLTYLQASEYLAELGSAAPAPVKADRWRRSIGF